MAFGENAGVKNDLMIDFTKSYCICSMFTDNNK